MFNVGEDSDICTELLQETFESLHILPEILLFDESKVSPVWTDILEKSSSFLRLVVLGYEILIALILRDRI